MNPRHHLYTMENTDKGDRVRIDIPDETDPDHQYHGDHGEVVNILSDDAGVETGDSRDSRLYRIQLESGETIDVRWRDIRPPIQ
jgi:ribosomal protein L21E